MELRKDPITRSWVVIGHKDGTTGTASNCPVCALLPELCLLRLPPYGSWQVCVQPSKDPLYRVEGDVSRRANGIYDTMRAVGADEIVIETPEHNRKLEDLVEDHILLVLDAWMLRVRDLKRDSRFKYVSVFKNEGVQAGALWPHAHSQVMATTFVPRRALYELRSAREWYKEKERCVFCDIVKQEERQGTRMVDTQGGYVALCPYASRVPYETWILDRRHNALFEEPQRGDNLRDLAALLRRTLRRLRQMAPAYHMVVHTAPNTIQKRDQQNYWQTIAEDYHWHIEILPIVAGGSRSYNLKEAYFNALQPEKAAEELRQLDPS